VFVFRVLGKGVGRSGAKSLGCATLIDSVQPEGANEEGGSVKPQHSIPLTVLAASWEERVHSLHFIWPWGSLS